MDNTRVVKAQRFQRMHLGPEILVIANAWDAASARVFEQAGIRAVGTGSAGVAFSHGFRDDEFIPREVMLRAIGEMVRAVDVPVTADILSGLGDTPEAVALTIREVIELGASGVNIEDGSDVGGPHLVDVELHCDKIRAACEAARKSGVDIVVNARTDSYWLKIGDATAQLRTSIERANRYREAGADCLFVPAVTDKVAIRTLVQFKFDYYDAHPWLVGLLNGENMLGAKFLRQSKRLRELNISLVETLTTILKAGVKSGVFRRGVDPLELYLSIASLSYFYFSNRATLSTSFGQALDTPAALKKRRENAVEVILGYLRA